MIPRHTKRIVFQASPMRKYKYFNNDEVRKGDVACNAKDIANKYVFQRSSLDICYLVCDTVEEFYAYYSAKDPSSRMHFEVINDSFTSQKLKIDIDGRIGDDEMGYVLRVLRKLFRRLTKACKAEMLVYDISTSHHIIVTNICFPTAYCCEMIANTVREKVSKRHPTTASLIDIGVYKKVQMFRVEGSTKYAQRRWKYLAGTKGLSPLETFKKGIISFVDNCHQVDADKVVDVVLDVGVYHLADSGPRTKVGATNRMIPKEYAVRKIMGSLTILDRVAPSYCSICKRTHERDGAYIVGGKLFCRRFGC